MLETVVLLDTFFIMKKIGSHTSSEHVWASVYLNWCVGWSLYVKLNMFII